MKTLPFCLLVVLQSHFSGAFADAEDDIRVTKRARVQTAPESKDYRIQEVPETWKAAETAVIVCDMWDAHHCFNAVGRVGELAPRLDDFVKEARRRGALIVHAPSSCMESYSGHPARVRAIEAPKAANLPPGIGQWLNWIDDREEKAGYPIDHSDGGEDDDPAEHTAWAEKLTAMGRNPAAPWQRQVERIGIDPEMDAITDSGEENWNLLEARGIKNVILTGVHTNMCVLGRPFGLRQMAKNGKNVVLVRDLTDTMYNPEMPPKVSHFSGNDLIIEHVEKYVCPTITSDQLLGGTTFVFAKDTRPRVLMLVSEPEYETEITLPVFARKHLAKDFKVDIATADPKDENGFVGLDAIEEADLLLVSVRRRALPEEQLAAIRKVIEAGKPVVGIRTASHAFSLRDAKPPNGHATWDDWDASILGGNYHGHHGAQIKTFGEIAPGAANHPVLAGVPEGEFATGGSLYEVSPLKDGTEVLLLGRADGIAAKEPVAWTNQSPAGGRVFYTSLGHKADFEESAFVTLLRNAVYWALEMAVPEERPTPEQSLRMLRTAPDLEVDLVLSEPVVTQPLHISFDARGRLWLVEYRQYPNPAGLQRISRDKVWRTVYDRTPPAPPHAADSPFRGKDRISIHEDCDGDGVYESHKVFVEGLNIATSVAHGRGGIWVTNPPYLLFYPDQDRDDVPDRDPEVHLEGFGLEDTHAVANSLVLGPDGWLYGAQGSTVSAAIRRPGIDSPETAVRTMGQNIWRYHPDLHLYEVFAEGGGNAYGVEIDSKGRIYSGHNGGDTRGFHYVQGGYFQKTFNKHGDHSNPYSFGFLPPMRHPTVPRFTHQFIVYESDALPESYRGKLIGVDVLHNNLVRSEITPDGSTFRTQDIDRPVYSEDSWFRPVMVAEGPDGNLYIADWYDKQVNHFRNHEGQIDHAMGRVYRLRAEGRSAAMPQDLSTASDEELLGLLSSHTRWQRMTALRLLAERKPDAILDRLIAKDSIALVEFWLLYQCHRWNDALARRALSSSDPAMRMWAVRLSEDQNVGDFLATMAKSEPSPEVRSQLAATSRRLPPGEGLPVLESLIRRHGDADDPHLPLMCWWGIEAHCDTSPEAVLALFKDPGFWSHPIIRETVASRLMRRFAASTSLEDWNRCAALFRACPDEDSREILLEGFEEATKGRVLSTLPGPLLLELAKSDGDSSLLIRMRRGDIAALREGLSSGSPRVIEVFGEIQFPDCVPVLLDRFRETSDVPVRRACLVALGAYESEAVAVLLIETFPTLDRPMKEAVANLLSGRSGWARLLLDAIETQKIAAGDIPLPLARKIESLGDPSLAERAWKHWSHGAAEPRARDTEIARITRLVAAGDGVPKNGESTYAQRCAACHTLFGQGGNIGPDLTSYQRDDLATMLLSIVDPSAEIREGFENLTVTMKDGRVIGGFSLSRDESSIALRDFAGLSHILPRDHIASIKANPASLMPPSLFEGLEDSAVRDLIAYLRSTTPPF